MTVQYARKHLRIATFMTFACICYFFSDHIRQQSSHALSRISIDRIISALPGQHKLVPFVLTSLPLGSITPSGWLQDQMQLMADGLAGHQHDFYEYVARSSWLGGEGEYSALNEGFPYWFNGLVPLAYSLSDDRLKQQVHTAADYVLDHQADDGWLGPEQGSDRLLWARFPLCLGLVQLAEANDTWKSPVLESLHKFNRLLNAMLKDDGLGYIMQREGDWRFSIFTWGRVRNADMIITLQWLYDHYPANKSSILLDNMRMLHDYGLKWENWYAESAYFGRRMHEDLWKLPENDTLPYYHYQHAVNVAQGLKSPAVIRRFTHNHTLLETASHAVDWTLTFHGAASGTIIGDERIVGLSPHSGSELCTSVELIYSLAYLYHATGDRSYADKAEIAAFNSLPAMFTPDYWGHLYFQSANQPSAINRSTRLFYEKTSWPQTFGLEPHYPCCTVNHPQGWPKYASHSFVKVGEDGIAHALLGPGQVRARLSTGKIVVQAHTAYPFADSIEYHINAEGSADFYVRVPSWAGKDSDVTVNSTDSVVVTPDDTTGLHKIHLEGGGETTITYNMHSTIRVETRANETISVFRGSLLYALEVKHKATSSRPKGYRTHEQHAAKYAPQQSKDWEYRNASAWNIAIDPWTLQWHAPTFTTASKISNPVFSSDANTGYISAQGCEIDWQTLEEGVPAAPPIGEDRHCVSESREVRLIPYGSAKLHMAEIPVIELPQQGE